MKAALILFVLFLQPSFAESHSTVKNAGKNAGRVGREVMTEEEFLKQKFLGHLYKKHGEKGESKNDFTLRLMEHLDFFSQRQLDNELQEMLMEDEDFKRALRPPVIAGHLSLALPDDVINDKLSMHDLKIAQLEIELEGLLKETYQFRVTKGYSPYLPRQYGKSFREPGARITSTKDIYNRMMADILKPNASVRSIDPSSFENDFPSLKHGKKEGLAWLHPTKGGHHVRVKKYRQYRVMDIDSNQIDQINALAKKIRVLKKKPLN